MLELTLGSGYVGQRFSGLCPRGSVGSHGLPSTAMVAVHNKVMATNEAELNVVEEFMERIEFRKD